MEKKRKEMNRRSFLKVLGTGAAASTATLYGCGDINQNLTPEGTATGEIPTE